MTTGSATPGQPTDPRPPAAPEVLRGGPLGAGRPPRVPLRITLVALLVGLLTVALVATGGTATSLLRGFLLDQQDQSLRSQVQDMTSDPAGLQRLCGMQRLNLPGGGTYVACLDTGGAFEQFAATRDEDRLPDVSEMSAANAAGYGTTPFTVRSVDGSTSWRLAVGQVSGDFAVVVGNDLGQDQAVVRRLVTIEVVVGLLVLALLGVAGYLLVRNSLRPLAEVEHTAQAIAAGDLSRRVPAGDERTEVGRLATALNGMLGRIESSFRAQQASEEQARASESQAVASEAQAVASEGRMRRFVADASHELRTPLTSIRGFAELHRQGAAGGPEETRRLMQRIEAEATRMGLLVEDLLQLARLDQQRPLSLGPVDLAAVAGDAVHDARAVQPERPIALHLDESLTDVPVVVGDEARLRQVVGNLVTNALTHTPPDARVTVRLTEDATDPGVVVLAVSDEGPGLAPADAQRVFERFYRADPSRTRAAGGTGLGLSIVAALVAAHGGRVDLDTAPGRGAAFAVRLPRSGPGTPGGA
ncbi:MAG: Sensor protein [Modestobacter sp.]|nr:Sensor protein [Modestobacter sp.]